MALYSGMMQGAVAGLGRGASATTTPVAPACKANAATGTRAPGVELLDSSPPQPPRVSVAAQVAKASKVRGIEEFREFLKFMSSQPPSAPHLRQETFSREFLYGEHD